MLPPPSSSIRLLQTLVMLFVQIIIRALYNQIWVVTLGQKR